MNWTGLPGAEEIRWPLRPPPARSGHRCGLVRAVGMRAAAPHAPPSRPGPPAACRGPCFTAVAGNRGEISYGDATPGDRPSVRANTGQKPQTNLGLRGGHPHQPRGPAGPRGPDLPPVRDAILDGRLEAGQTLPPSRELARRLAVHVTPSASPTTGSSAKDSSRPGSAQAPTSASTAGPRPAPDRSWPAKNSISIRGGVSLPRGGTRSGGPRPAPPRRMTSAWA